MIEQPDWTDIIDPCPLPVKLKNSIIRVMDMVHFISQFILFNSPSFHLRIVALLKNYIVFNLMAEIPLVVIKQPSNNQ